MIRSVAFLVRRLAGSPGLRGLAVLAVLAAAALFGAAPSGARAAGPACPIAGHPAPTALSGMAPDTEARRSTIERTGIDRADVCAIDVEAPADLGLPRPPTDASHLGRMSAAFFRPVSDEIPASAPSGSPRRPPRVA